MEKSNFLLYAFNNAFKSVNWSIYIWFNAFSLKIISINSGQSLQYTKILIYLLTFNLKSTRHDMTHMSSSFVFIFRILNEHWNISNGAIKYFLKFRSLCYVAIWRDNDKEDDTQRRCINIYFWCSWVLLVVNVSYINVRIMMEHKIKIHQPA